VCGAELTPNEALEISACPHCEGARGLDDSEDENRGNAGAIGRLLSFCKAVYGALPKSLRAYVSPATFYFYGLLNSIRPKVWRIEGEGCGSSMTISVCLYATTAQFRSFAGELIFGTSFRSSDLGRTWVWNTQRVPKGASAFALIMSETDKPFLRLLLAGCGVLIPAWVNGEAALPRSHREKQRMSAKNRYRKIREHSLEFEITHDQRLFDDFYDNMHVPHAKQRFGDSLHMCPRIDAQADFDKGELLLVRRRGEYISGLLITYEGECICLRWLGVRDGNREYVEAGAIAACFEFALRHAEEKGCRTARFYRSRAFLQDGVLRFKRTLSQRIVEADHHKFLLRILSDSVATRAFLENSPFIFERFDKLHGAVFLSSDTPLTIAMLRRVNKEHFHPGMSQLVVFQFSREMTSSEGWAASVPTPELAENQSTDSDDPLRYRQLSNAEWTDLIWGLGFGGIRQAVAIYPRETN
jgi:hypothetical protein